MCRACAAAHFQTAANPVLPHLGREVLPPRRSRYSRAITSCAVTAASGAARPAARLHSRTVQSPWRHRRRLSRASLFFACLRRDSRDGRARERLRSGHLRPSFMKSPVTPAENQAERRCTRTRLRPNRWECSLGRGLVAPCQRALPPVSRDCRFDVKRGEADA